VEVSVESKDLTPPISKQSLLMIPDSPGGDEEVEYQPHIIEIERREKRPARTSEDTVRLAANRPGLSPPTQNVSTSQERKELEVMHDEEGGKSGLLHG
jgi:hypothetical protein